MFVEALLATAFQIGPFYEQRDGYKALRPFWSEERATTDVLWPAFTKHRDWWRFCFFMHFQDYPDGGWQFDLLPLWWNGKAMDNRGGEGRSYAGLFPIYGRHPHFMLVYDLEFALWPLWTRYRMPRPAEKKWMTTNAVLWPLLHWRDDGSWGFWPLYVCNQQRESFHWSVLWPIFTRATYEKDRDTAGEGSSWMLWPLWADVSRERESQWMFLPPLFSYAETTPGGELAARGDAAKGTRLRCPWPIFEWERTSSRDRISVFPLWERVRQKRYFDGESTGGVDRFGWMLVEIYDDETRVFPFWTSRSDGSYFRLWPFWESARGEDGATRARLFSLFPIRWVPAVDRNWAKYWTFYEREETAAGVAHSLLWGIIRWNTDAPEKDVPEKDEQ